MWTKIVKENKNSRVSLLLINTESSKNSEAMKQLFLEAHFFFH